MKKILKNIGLFNISFLLLFLISFKSFAASSTAGLTPALVPFGGGELSAAPDILSSLLVAQGLNSNDWFNIFGIYESPDNVFNYPEGQKALYDALNDTANDPTLGDDLEKFVNVYSSIKASNGYATKVNIDRPLWDRLTNATKNGLNISISQAGESVPFSDFYEDYLVGEVYSFEMVYKNPAVFTCAYLNPSTYYNIVLGCESTFTVINNIEYLKLIDQEADHVYVYSGNANGAPSSDVAHSKIYYSVQEARLELINGVKYCRVGGDGIPVYNYGAVGSSTVLNKSIRVHDEFISSKASGSYDVISSTSTIDDLTGQLDGDVSVSILSPDQLAELENLISEGKISLIEAMDRLGVFPYDDVSGELIGSSMDPAYVQELVAEGIADYAPTEPFLQFGLNQIDNWDPVVIAPDLPFSGSMNWLAAQMNTIMNLTNFHNVWLILSTLAVAALIIGLKRLWR